VNRKGELTRTDWKTLAGNVCKKGTQFVEIWRNDHTESDFKAVDASSYVPFNLYLTFALVILLGILRLVAVYTAKFLLSKEFRKEARFADQIDHIMFTNIGAVPDTFTKWENGETYKEIQKKYSQQWNEMLALLTINCFENLTHLVPITLTWIKIAARHSLLEDSIGTTIIEDTSYSNCFSLMVFAYCLAILSFCFQIFLYHLYNNHMHLWKDLLQHSNLKTLKECGNKEFTSELVSV
jgi:hypothetical protein